MRSEGYVEGAGPFPVLTLSSATIDCVFRNHANNLRADLIGIVEREMRSGYAGFIFLSCAVR